jgi:uncharacterized protein (DUF736 family)
MAEEKAQYREDYGAIWIKDGENGQIILNIGIQGVFYTGKMNASKPNDPESKLPDYLVFNGDGQEVGAAWKGRTKQDREKLRIKLGELYMTAVMRDEVKGKQADMVIFDPQN